MTKKIIMPTPIIKEIKTDKNVFFEAISLGATKLQAKIIANRKIPEGVSISEILQPNFKNLDVNKLDQISIAADRISDAIINKEYIALLCDFDVDGISSCAVLFSSFVEYFNCDPSLIKICISNRMKAGYGFSDEALDRILNMTPIPSLLITADQGSKDGERISKYVEFMKNKKLKGDVIVTDHHHIDGKGPKDAIAVINPQKEGDLFPDKTICGCTVALLVMVATREALIKKNYLPSDSPKLTDLLTYSTAATIADCVSMASPINRAIVNRGLSDMNRGTKAAWRVMKRVLLDGQTVRSDSIGFNLGPVINACSRTGGNGLAAVKFYLAETEDEAERYLDMLRNQNEERKKIEKRLVTDALIQASELYNKGYNGLTIYLEDGHHGIHGIAASRICERFGAPVIICSPKHFDEVIEEQEVEKKTEKMINGHKVIDKKIVKENVTVKKVHTISGSARSIEEVDLHECLHNIDEKYKQKEENIFLGFGGHSMAAGLTLPLENFEKLREEFKEEVDKHINRDIAKPVIYVDGNIPNTQIIDFNFLNEILFLEPYGNGFDYPTFVMEANILSFEIIGKNKDTAKGKILFGNQELEIIWFKYDQSVMFQKLKNGQFCRFAVQIRESFFRGNRDIKIHVVHADILY